MKNFNKDKEAITTEIAERGVTRCEEEIYWAKMLLDKIEMAEILPREDETT